MQIAIVYAGKNRNDAKLQKIAQGFAKGLATQGHSVDTFDMHIDMDKSLTMYDYVIVGSTNLTSFGGSIPSLVSQYLKRCGTITGKRCFAFISGGGLRKQKTLSSLMKAMESEGMYLKNSDIVNKSDVAFAIGKRLNVERNL